MKIQFHGATRTVTGSKYLVTANNKNILVDCGLFQGLKKLRLKNWERVEMDVSSIDYIVLTHAHIDHSGYIPKLINLGFKGKIICTKATFDLCRILLPDCGFLMEEEARYANSKGFSKHSPALPLFTREDAEKSLDFFKTVDYQTPFDLGSDLKVSFHNAGHILGASSVILDDGSTKICFSGDLGRDDDPILYAPEYGLEADYLVMESTYGNRVHPEIDAKKELEAIINKTIKRNGVIVVPAFAVGRAQLLLYYVDQLIKEKRIPNIPVYLNSPMAIDVTRLYPGYNKICRLDLTDCQSINSVAKVVRTPEESKALNLLDEPMIIVSASGMATGGRVIHHIKAFAPKSKNTILFTGFQAQGTRGANMVAGCETVRMHGMDIPINAEIYNMESLSAHADSDGLMNWVKCLKKKPKKIFITHGESSASEALKTRISEELGIECVVPEYQDEVDL